MAAFPTPLDAYPPTSDGLVAMLGDRIAMDPFNAVATGIFVLAILHTFLAARFTALAHSVQSRHDRHSRAASRPATPSVLAGSCTFWGKSKSFSDSGQSLFWSPWWPTPVGAGQRII